MENQKKDEKKKKKGLFYVLTHRENGKKSGVLILALFFTIVMATTATYAWFTANYTVSVTKLDVTVASGAGIQISTDAITWKSMINSTELLSASATYPAAVNQVPTQTNSGSALSPVSTVKTVNDITGTTAGGTQSLKGLTMYLGNVTSNVDGDYILTTTEQTDTNGKTGHYLAFDVFIKSDFSQSVPLYLTKATSVHGYTELGGTDKDIEYASRIAIIEEGNIASSATTAQMQGLNTGTSVKFIEPNYEVHTATGVTHARDVYGITTTTTASDAIPYSGVKAEIAASDASAYPKGVKWGEATATKYSSLFEDVTVDFKLASTNDTSDTGTRTELMTLAPGVTKLRLYMWIEGQDIDCENNASGGSILFNIGFEVDEPVAS